MTWNIAMPEAEWVDRSSPNLPALIQTLTQVKKVAIDTETTGLVVWKDQPLFWSLSFNQDLAYRRICLPADTLPLFKDIFKDPTKRWIFANAKFDMHMLDNIGIQLAGEIADIQVMHSLLYEEQSHALKDMAHHLLGWRWKDFTDTFRIGKAGKLTQYSTPTLVHLGGSFQTVQDAILWCHANDREKLVEYAANDAYGTLLCYQALEKELKQAVTYSLYNSEFSGWNQRPHRKKLKIGTQWDLFEQVEIPFTKVLWECERNGILIDKNYLDKVSQEVKGHIKQLEKDAWQIYGGPINLNSPAQLSEYFFKIKKLTPVSYTKGGKKGIRSPSCDREFLAHYAGSDALAKIALKHRDLSKLQNTYLEKLPGHADRTGRIHTRLNQATARTGRLSCVAPWTEIYTKRGRIPISDLEVGDLVRTHKQRFRPVKKVFTKGLEEMFCLCLNNGQILTCTGDHRLLLKNGTWIAVKDLTKDIFPQELASSSGPPVFVESTYFYGKIMVWDMTVEEDASYEACGIFSHNSSEPNLQQTPNTENDQYKLRKAFIAPENWKIICFDYDQLEMRLLGAAALEKSMIDIFQAGKDIHIGNAELVFGLPYDDIKKAKTLHEEDWSRLTPEQEAYFKKCLHARSATKTIGFGLNYGMKEKLLASKIGCTEKEAQETIERYMNALPAVRAFYQEAIEECQSTGYSFTLLGRRRFLPEITADQSGHRGKAERQAVNNQIQGCLPASTRILTKSGYVPIGKAPKRGLVWTGTEWAKYQKLYRGLWELATIRLANGRVLNCDTRHEVLVEETGIFIFKNWQDLKVGDRVCLAIPQPVHTDRVLKLSLECCYGLGVGVRDVLPHPDRDTLPADLCRADLEQRKVFLAGLLGKTWKKQTSLILQSPKRSLLEEIQMLLRITGVSSQLKDLEDRSFQLEINPTSPTSYKDYDRVEIVGKEALGINRRTFTLSVDSPLHRFDSEGIISKNTAAEAAKLAMLNCYEAQLEKRYACRMLLQIHDELVFECPNETVKEASEAIQEMMQDPFPSDLAVSITASGGSGRSWAQAKEG